MPVKSILSALSHGYSLALDRLDEALVDGGIDRIVCLGRIFDPQRFDGFESVSDPHRCGSVPERVKFGHDVHLIAHCATDFLKWLQRLSQLCRRDKLPC